LANPRKTRREVSDPVEGTPSPSGYQPLLGSERPRDASHKLIGPVNADVPIYITILIRPRPGSPPMPDLEYWQQTPLVKRRFLTPDEFTRTYGAAQADLDAVAAFVSAHGMTVLESHAGRRSVSVQGTAAKMNSSFGIELKRYEAPLPTIRRPSTVGTGEESSVLTHTYHGYDGPVHLPIELAGIVTSVVGLDNRILGGPGGSGDPNNANLISVPSIAARYNFPNSGALGQTIGVFAGQKTPGSGASYLSSDITQYFQNLPTGYKTAPNIAPDINLTVGTNTFSDSPATVQQINNQTNFADFPYSWILELTQDISTAATIAQGATVNVYFTENSEQGWVVFLNRVLVPESGEQQPTVVTSSWYVSASDDTGSIGSIDQSGSTASLMSGLFQQLALLGINVFNCCGDNGADAGIVDGNTHLWYPGSDPWITSCGGTIVGDTEVVWSDAFSNSQFGSSTSDFGATGGGASTQFPVPTYQAGIQIKDSNGNTTPYTGKRGVPDVAGMVGYNGFLVNGISYYFVGTSCVAPLYAGLTAVLQSAFGLQFGFLNPTLYQLGNIAFNDVTNGNNDSGDTPDSPYFTATAGWDPCTGSGSIDGTKLLNGIAGLLYTQTFYFVVDKSTFGLDEVREAASYPTAFWLVLEGFTPNTLANWGQGGIPVLTYNLPNVTIAVGTAQPEIPTQPDTPQRILFPCSISFQPAAIATTGDTPPGVFPAPGGQIPVPIYASISSPNLTAATVLKLVGGADPYFTNINPQENNVFFLSQDLRVFTVTPGINNTPISGVAGAPTLSATSNTAYDTNAGYQYIQNLLTYLNNNYSTPSGTDPFTLFPGQSSALTGDSSVTPSTFDPSNPGGTPFSNYNFAVARVRMNGQANSSSVKNVRVFFRVFVSQSCDTDYNTNTTYPYTADAAGEPGSPLVGTGNTTIPFFATGNYSANSDFGLNVDYSANSINNQPIQTGASGSVWAYYGCYLNLYPTGNTISVNGTATPLLSLFQGTHHCLVAQIAFDDTPIVNEGGTTENPEDSDKLAQRNLQITLSEDPGAQATRSIPQTFDLRPSASISTAKGNLLDYPDELMIDWGNTPIGSKASIYWPQVHSADVLALAKQLYSTHQLSATDANTIQCTITKGVTFVPIVPGTNDNYAGLFTVDLQPGVVQGQEFNITVRRIATRQFEPPVPEIQNQTTRSKARTEETNPVMQNWRYVIGTFGVRIPVTKAEQMLPPEMNTLAIKKWVFGNISSNDRWYPVLQRYVSYVASRVDGLGGNSASIQPSPQGVPPSQIYIQYTGGVTELIYNRHGDFRGFLLATEDREYKFLSRNKDVERVVERAWQDRLLLKVWSERNIPHSVVSVGLLESAGP
jgi:hypothetical protein